MKRKQALITSILIVLMLIMFTMTIFHLLDFMSEQIDTIPKQLCKNGTLEHAVNNEFVYFCHLPDGQIKVINLYAVDMTS